MMEIYLLDKEGALIALNSWLETPRTAEEIPVNTFGAFHNDKLIAIAGLRICEGPACIMDSLATNPSASSALRSEAIAGLTERIMDAARTMGFSILCAQSGVASIAARAVAMGFELQPEIPFFRRLT